MVVGFDIVSSHPLQFCELQQLMQLHSMVLGALGSGCAQRFTTAYIWTKPIGALNILVLPPAYWVTYEEYTAMAVNFSLRSCNI